ncbi:signal recognition particle 54 kDa protein 2 [Artemisia annua]|uniref:Signal recognition particle 54 kDa protein 2 n=1 Tax=Artemisia annua TaxID=35608 RepID=A0A2U1Q0S7_ARTAN|nr:signal recognition particle 54 kDa protein 2 [Artemisia annua]
MESLSSGIEPLKNAMIMDENVVNECLYKITRALRQSDVQIKLVHDMKTNIKKLLDDAGRIYNKQIIFLRAIYDELCKMLHHPGKLSFTPNKGNPTVVMFVGPQGSGKTTTCAKYAYYHQNKG